jgi:hypothetical protein
MNWLYIHLGVNGTGPYYGFWSGFGSDLGELAIAGALVRMVNCHEKGCWRFGLFYKGHVVCHKHRHNVGGTDGRS